MVAQQLLQPGFECPRCLLDTNRRLYLLHSRLSDALVRLNAQHTPSCLRQTTSRFEDRGLPVLPTQFSYLELSAAKTPGKILELHSRRREEPGRDAAR